IWPRPMNPTRIMASTGSLAVCVRPVTGLDQPDRRNRPIRLSVPRTESDESVRLGPAAVLERAKGFEPSTPTLARLCSTPELRPLGVWTGAAITSSRAVQAPLQNPFTSTPCPPHSAVEQE